MELFKKERRVNASMEKCQAKMERMKGGSGKEGASKKIINFVFEVEITKAIREMLDPSLHPLINLDGSGEGPVREFPINSLEPAKQVLPAVISVFSRQNWSKDSEPIWTAGGADAKEQATICLKKLVIKEDKAVLQMDVKVNFMNPIWKWAGDCIGGGECVFKFKPLQGELFEDQDADAAEKEKAEKDAKGKKKDDDDPRPNSLKEKTDAKEKSDKKD